MLYTACVLHGTLLPWESEATKGERRICCIIRLDMRGAAVVAAEAAALAEADAASAVAYSQWLAAMPPVLQQLAPWVLTREDASMEELLDLQAALQVLLWQRFPVLQPGDMCTFAYGSTFGMDMQG